MPQYEEQLTTLLNTVQQHASATQAAILQQVTAVVNKLIEHDFSKLVEILYRVDVHEAKLKENIAQHPDDAVLIIAQMLLERQRQKSALRESFRASQDSISDEERW